jgi:hypothetical protein
VAVIVLLTTIYVRTPLEFSIFPSLLLATTLLPPVLAQPAGGGGGGGQRMQGGGINYAPQPAVYVVGLVDAKNRTVGIRAADGRTGTVHVAESVYDLSKLKSGDKIRVDFIQPDVQRLQFARIDLHAHRAGRRLQQAGQQPTGGGLARARLAHQGQALAPRDGEAQVVDGVDERGGPAKRAPAPVLRPTTGRRAAPSPNSTCAASLRETSSSSKMYSSFS